MVLWNGFERKSDSRVAVEAFFVYQIVKPPLVENGLHFRKNCLDWVELGWIGYVEDRFDVELLPKVLHIFRLVHIQLIHEQCQWARSVPSPKCFNVAFKGHRRDRAWIDVSQADSFALRYRSNNWLVAGVNVFLVDGEVGVLHWPLF